MALLERFTPFQPLLILLFGQPLLFYPALLLSHSPFWAPSFSRQRSIGCHRETAENLCRYSRSQVRFTTPELVAFRSMYTPNYTEKNISKFFLFFIGVLPQRVENRKIYYLKGSIYYCKSEIRR